MGFRKFLEQLESEGKLTRIRKEVSTELEMAGIIDTLGEKPCFFEKVKQILRKLSSAIENPLPPTVVKKGECQEIVERNVDLTKLPIMRYTEKDGGKYVPSAISIVKDP